MRPPLPFPLHTMNKNTVSIDRMDLYVVVAAAISGWAFTFFLIGLLVGITK